MDYKSSWHQNRIAYTQSMNANAYITKAVLRQELARSEERTIASMDAGFAKVDKRFKSLENRIIKKLNIIAEFFDQPILDHEKRIKRVETHLGLPKLANWSGDIIKTTVKYRSKVFKDLLRRLIALGGVRRWEIASDKMKTARDLWKAGQIHAANRAHWNRWAVVE